MDIEQELRGAEWKGLRFPPNWAVDVIRRAETTKAGHSQKFNKAKLVPAKRVEKSNFGRDVNERRTSNALASLNGSD